MCEYCHSTDGKHPAGCPCYEPELSGIRCVACGREFEVGEEYWEDLGEAYCEECWEARIQKEYRRVAR